MNRRELFAALLGCATAAAAPVRVVPLRLADSNVGPIWWTAMTVDGFTFYERCDLTLVQEMSLEEFRRRYP